MTLTGYHALYENAVWYDRFNVDESYQHKEELLKHSRDNKQKVLGAQAEVEELRVDVNATRKTLKGRL